MKASEFAKRVADLASVCPDMDVVLMLKFQGWNRVIIDVDIVRMTTVRCDDGEMLRFLHICVDKPIPIPPHRDDVEPAP